MNSKNKNLFTFYAHHFFILPPKKTPKIYAIPAVLETIQRELISMMNCNALKEYFVTNAISRDDEYFKHTGK